MFEPLIVDKEVAGDELKYIPEAFSNIWRLYLQDTSIKPALF